ncbi:MAG: ATP synthase F1 subunit epsilon [Chloroflexi bacterium]|nr:ATP synthase F1 subunit epsilon [Chloroflexota bacterium]MDL1884608.1 ATP synthase F1 subunit epsilon [Anaerolineae bacterium CFX8]GIL11891.1 MAG: ATP synthase epsilon chain [Chloroflexota bacterium]
MPIHVEVVTQERKVFEEPEADMVLIPASEGEMGVLPHHAPVLTTLGFGELVIRKGEAEERFAVYGGVVDVRPDKVVVLADLAESSFELDMQAIESARERVAKLLAQGIPPEQNRQAALELRRAEMALKIKSKLQARGSVLRIVDQQD